MTRIQQPFNSSPNAAALRASTLSLDRKTPPPSLKQTPNYNATNSEFVNSRNSAPGSPVRENTSKNHLLPTQQGFLKGRVQEPPHRSPRDMSDKTLYSPMATADLPTMRFGEREGGESQVDGGYILPVRGTVTARRQLFQDNIKLQDDSPALSVSTTRLQKIPRICSTPPSPNSQGVDQTSLEDISSLKSMFEKSLPGGSSTARPIKYPPTIHVPKPLRPVPSLDNPSLTAAILAIQRSPSNSTQNSRRGSPILKPISVPACGSPTQRNAPNPLSSSNAIPKLALPPPHGASNLSRPNMSSMAPKEPIPSNVSIAPGHNNALLAATLAAKPKSPPDPESKAQPPKPPPPRRAQTTLKAAPNGKTSDIEDNSDAAFISSATTGCSKYDTARSPVSPKLSRSLSHSPTSPAPPLPRRRLSIGNISLRSTGDNSSAAFTAAILSATTSRTLSASPAYSSLQPSPPLRHLTGDSAPAASLAPSRVTSPAPKKLPAPPAPAPRRGRRKSLPPPPKAGLRGTMREPPKDPPKNYNPQRRGPHLAKHHPHKHAEGERRRWQHFVTDIERKRYEGLWAANKGLLVTTESNKKMPATAYSAQRTKSHGPHNFQQQHVWSSTPNYIEPLEDCIDSLIARDIWARSRLAFNHLADVWDLVDRGEKGRLSRDEFVVGTWLVDQSLKGRKLPASVQDEVWLSVRRLGIKA